MRTFFTSLLLVTLIFISQFAFANPAATIDELAAPYNVDGCRNCHETTHDEWKSSWHSKSIVDSRVLRTWRTFILSGIDKSAQAKRRDLKDACLRCHAPQTKDASDELVTEITNLIVTAVDDADKNKREAATKELSKLSINCLVCHNLKATPDNNPKQAALYGSKGDVDPKEPTHAGYETIKSDYLPKAEFCKQCHHGCPTGMPSTVCPTLWTSYEEHYLANGGKETCQGCHMKETNPDEPRPHRFPGIHDADQVKKGTDLTITARPTKYVYHLENKFVPAVVVQVDVKNNAGHGIPYG